MQINHPIWLFGPVKLNLSHHRKKQRHPGTKGLLPVNGTARWVELGDGHDFSWKCFLTSRWLTSFGSDTVMGVSLHCEMDRERLLKYRGPRRARFQQEKMKVVKANIGNQEFQWNLQSDCVSEGIDESKSLWKVDDKPQLLGWMVRRGLFYIWNGRKFLYFPPAGFPHSRCPYVRPLPSHTDECVYNQCPEVSPCSEFSGEIALRDTDACRVTSASQLHHSAILIHPGDHASPNRRRNLVNSKFSVIQGRRTFQAKQKIRTTNFHTYWSGLFEKPLMKPEAEFWVMQPYIRSNSAENNYFYRIYNTYVESMEQCDDSSISQLRGQITEVFKCVTTPWIMGYMTHAQAQRHKNQPRCEDILKLIQDVVGELSRQVQRHQRCVDGVTRVNVRHGWGGVVSPPGGAPLCHGWTGCGWCCAAPAASHLVHLPIRADMSSCTFAPSNLHSVLMNDQH